LSTTTLTSRPPIPLKSGSADLTISRRLVLIHGADAPKFLNGAITNKIPALSHREGIYSAFLTAQGRVLFDVFIYPIHHSTTIANSSLLGPKADISDPGYIIECDASVAQALHAHFKKYKLRSKFTHRIISEDELNVWSVWGSDVPMDVGCWDPRAPGMGQRIILPTHQSAIPTIPDNLDNSDLDNTTRHAQYTIRRYQLGIPEGQNEIISQSSLPQESNLDYMNGIDYRKGCYVGQELTIRTHHTGVVRKRILPIQLFPDSTDTTVIEGVESVYDPVVDVPTPPSQTSIKAVEKKGRSAGKICGSVGNVGLALCRLEMMTSVSLPGGMNSYNAKNEWKVEWGEEEGSGSNGEHGSGSVKIKAFVPEWHTLHSTTNNTSP